MDFDSLEEFKKYAERNSEEIINKSSGGSVEIECPKCGKLIVLKLPSNNEVLCVECGSTIKIDFI